MSEFFNNIDVDKLKTTKYEELIDTESGEYLSVLQSTSECGKFGYKKVVGCGKETAPRLAKMYSQDDAQNIPNFPLAKTKPLKKLNNNKKLISQYNSKPSLSYRIKSKRKGIVRFFEKYGVSLIVFSVLFAICFSVGGTFINSMMGTYQSLGPTLSLILIVFIAASIFGS